VLAAQANADDIATLFWEALNGPPEVPVVIEGETLLPGAGYPSVVIEKLRFAMPSVIFLDRALAHLASHVQHIGTVLFGARVECSVRRAHRASVAI
jgi:putative transposase